MIDRGKKYGWGLIGPGRFAREFAVELRMKDRCDLVAVASRSKERADEFAKEFGFARAYGDIDGILNDPDVDIIYIVVPHVFHRDIAERAIRAGKAVVCEKPLTISEEETRCLTALASEHGVFLMEAMKTAFLPAIRKAKRWINEGRIGEVRLMKADFCFHGSTEPDDRLMNPSLGGGAVPDVGIYPLFMCRHFLGEVVSLEATGKLASTGVEDTAAILACHEGGSIGVLTCSFRTEESVDAVILGTEGEIRIPRFHAATRALMFRNGVLSAEYCDETGGMVRGEIDGVLEALDEGLIESPSHGHRDSIRLASLVDEVRFRLGA